MKNKLLDIFFWFGKNYWKIVSFYIVIAVAGVLSLAVLVAEVEGLLGVNISDEKIANILAFGVPFFLATLIVHAVAIVPATLSSWVMAYRDLSYTRGRFIAALFEKIILACFLYATSFYFFGFASSLFGLGSAHNLDKNVQEVRDLPRL